jgi:undecaprenyl-diphosphatase
MSAITSILLGIIQGLTEFLPISSSAHLVFAEQLLKLTPNIRLSYSAFLHLGTTLALLIFFGKRISQIIGSVFAKDRIESRTNLLLILYIIIGSIPAAIIGFLFKDKIEFTFVHPMYPAIFLIFTGALLFATKLVKSHDRKLNLIVAILIGVAQAIALLPGISRSGSTIAAALLLGLSSFEAFEFSFLLSIPAVIGANLFTFKDLSNASISGSLIIPGILISAITGLLALRLLKNLVLRKRLYYFGFYCIILSILALIFLV